MSKRWIVWIVLGAAGCASSHNTHHDDAGVPSDGNRIDGAPDAVQVTPSAQLTPAGGRMSGGVYKMDVQLGQPFSQKPATAAGKKFEANTAVKP